MELNREQIIRALKCCTKGSCKSCPKFKSVPCQIPLMQDALALIKELTEENVEVKANWQKLKESHESACEECRAEFARLKAENERLAKQCGEIIVECDERDAERLKQVAKLTEENKAWQEQLISQKEKANKAYYELACEVEDLRAENERLRAEGEWLPQFEGARIVKCSVCGYEYCDLIECGNYCGNCGAKMKGR